MRCYSCDVCSSSGQMHDMGFNARILQSYIGLRYQYRHYISSPHDKQISADLRSNEHFHQTALMGKWAWRKHWHTSVYIPFFFNYRNYGQVYQHAKGLADIQCMQYFIPIIQQKIGRQHSLQLTWILGAGIKMPTGKYNALQDFNILPANMQTGSGTFDALAHSMIILQNQQLSLQAEFNAKFNQQNKFDYKMGNSIQCQVTLGKSIGLKKQQLYIFTASQFEHTKQDKQFDALILPTGGELLQQKLGIQYLRDHVQLGMFVSIPIYQKLSAGYVHAYPQTGLQCLYFIPSKK